MKFFEFVKKYCKDPLGLEGVDLVSRTAVELLFMFAVTLGLAVLTFGSF
jgi:hypothetical protein